MEIEKNKGERINMAKRGYDPYVAYELRRKWKEIREKERIERQKILGKNRYKVKEVKE